MEIKRFENEEAIALATADLFCEHLKNKPESVLCVAAGHSSIGPLKILVERYERGEVDFSKAKFIAMDEWLHMNETVPGSCGDFLHKNFLDRVNFAPENIRLIDGCAEDMEAECAALKADIEKAGGFDIILLGMGMNGHLALNEPGTPFDSTVHTTQLDPITKEVGKKYFEDVPQLTGGVTIGLGDMAEGKDVVLIVFGEKKREIIQKLLDSEPTTDLPASFLKTVPQARIWHDLA